MFTLVIVYRCVTGGEPCGQEIAGGTGEGRLRVRLPVFIRRAACMSCFAGGAPGESAREDCALLHILCSSLLSSRPDEREGLQMFQLVAQYRDARLSLLAEWGVPKVCAECLPSRRTSGIAAAYELKHPWARGVEMRPASIQRGVAQSGRHACVGTGCRCATDLRRGLMRSHVLLLLGLFRELSLATLALAPPAGAADHGAQLHRRHWCGGWPGFCVRAMHPSVHACCARCVIALHVVYNSREFGLTLTRHGAGQ
jgi:hypothetical protein